MSTAIHPTAVVADGASLGVDVQIGPFCVVGAEVQLGDRVRLHSHVVVTGHTTLGEDCEVYPFAVLGTAPQDVSFKGEKTELVIGARNRIREHVTMNCGTTKENLVTRVGDDGFFLIGCHVAHDCVVGNNVIIANEVALAGHVKVGDFAYLGGLAAIHQFARIGRYAMIGGMAAVEDDVIPYGLVAGNRATLQGLNLVGMKRRGFPKDEIHIVRRAYKELFHGDGTFAERVEHLARAFADAPRVMEIVAFIRSEDARRSIVMPLVPAAMRV